jgi:hypothetical protein
VCKCVLLPPGDNPIAVNKYIVSYQHFPCIVDLAEGFLCNRRNLTKTFTYEFHTFCVIKSALSWLRLLIAGLLLQRASFDFQPLRVEFVMNEITLGEVLSY